MLDDQEPVELGNLARWPILPSLPTLSPSRSSSLVMRSLSSTTSLKASAISPSKPTRPIGSLTEKSPLRKALRAASKSWLSRLREEWAAEDTGAAFASAALAISDSLSKALKNAEKPARARKPCEQLVRS